MVSQEAKFAGWLDSLVKKLHFDKFDISSGKLIEVGASLGIGFLAGFLLKRCLTYVIIAVLTIAGILFLSYSGVLTITYDPIKMQELFGIKQTVTVDTGFIMVYWGWIKANLAICMSFLVGLLVGLKVA